MSCSSSRTAPAWVLSTGCSPSGTHCSSVGPPQGHRSCQKTCSCMISASWGNSSCQEPAPACTLHRVQVMSTCCGVGSSIGCIVNIHSGVVLHKLQGTTCSTTVFCRSFRGVSAPVTGAPPASPSPLALGCAGLFLSHFSHSSLSQLLYISFHSFLHVLWQRCHQCC